MRVKPREVLQSRVDRRLATVLKPSHPNRASWLSSVEPPSVQRKKGRRLRRRRQSRRRTPCCKFQDFPRPIANRKKRIGKRGGGTLFRLPYPYDAGTKGMLTLRKYSIWSDYGKTGRRADLRETASYPCRSVRLTRSRPSAWGRFLRCAGFRRPHPSAFPRCARTRDRCGRRGR